jgi:hypothetical protein
MAKKTRTELSTLAINTNLPDNTQELITPTTERAQLTDERESVVNYKDDLGGTTNAGKFLTVATDGESLTMVDAPTGDVTGTGVQYQVAVWDGTNSLTGNAAFRFLTGAQNSIKLTRGTGSGNILFYAADGTTLHGYIENQVSGNGLTIGQQDGSTSAVIDLDDSTITLKTDNNTALTISSGGLVQVGDGTNQNTFLTTKSVAGWASGIKLTRGLGDGSDISNNNFGMLVTDNGWEVSTFTSPLDNTTGRSAKLVISSGGDATLNGYLKLGTSASQTILGDFGETNTYLINYNSGGSLKFLVGGGASSNERLIIGSNWTSNLNAYEESTWTPDVESTAGGPYTVINRRGKYIKIGKHVTVQFYFIVSVVNGGTGAKITNLPFATKSGAAGDNYIGNSWNTSNGQLSSAVAAQNGTIAYLYVYSGTNPIGQGQGNTGTITYISQS